MSKIRGCFRSLKNIFSKKSNSENSEEKSDEIQKPAFSSADSELMHEYDRSSSETAADAVEQYSSSCTHANKPENNNEQILSIGPHEEKYRMDHEDRGLLLIFNHRTFDQSTGQPQRNGTEKDVEKIRNTFKQIGFQIHPYVDMSLDDIRNHIKGYVTTDYYHKKRDCIAIFVLTHGEMRGDKYFLWARDACYDPAEELWGQLTGDKCPAFAGKPKLFFIQACQGNKLDNGTVISKFRTQFDSKFQYTVPICADILIAYATYEGYYAFRNEVYGSYWITVLCEELEKHYKSLNILDILTFVNRRVAVDFTSSNKKDQSRDGLKQIPYFKSTLTRLLVFGEK